LNGGDIFVQCVGSARKKKSTRLNSKQTVDENNNSKATSTTKQGVAFEFFVVVDRSGCSIQLWEEYYCCAGGGGRRN